MLRNEYLRDMAMPYVKNAIKEGVSEAEMYLGISLALRELEKFKNSKSEENVTVPESNPDAERNKKRYFELAEKVLLQNEIGKSLPKRHENALTILYFIHQNEYTNVNEFIGKLSKILSNDEKYLRVKILGQNYAYLYAGMWCFLSMYAGEDDKPWSRSSLSGRIRIMEKAEKKLYSDMLTLEKKIGRE